jgi:hypothetical protein
MSFKVGDKVKFLNDVGGGRIKIITEKGKAVVETTDGFDMPVILSELVKDVETFSYESSGRKKIVETEEDDFDEDEIKIVPKRVEPKHVQVKEPIPEEVEEIYEPEEDAGEGLEDVDPRFYLVLTRENDDLFHVHLINDSNYLFFFNILLKHDDLFCQVQSGLLEANTKQFITKYNRKEVNQFLSFLVQGILWKKGVYDPIFPIHQIIEIKPLNVFSNISWIENDFFNEKAILFEIEIRKSIENEVNKLGNIELQKIIHQKEENEKKKDEARKEKKATTDIVEFDLHIEELLDDHSGMTSGQIIEYQLDRFKSALNEAIDKKTKKIVFIHGIGNGRLKLELRKTLEEKYHQVYYQDASFKEYGFGATMVIIK